MPKSALAAMGSIFGFKRKSSSGKGGEVVELDKVQAKLEEKAERTFARLLDQAEAKLGSLYTLGSPKHKALNGEYWALQREVAAGGDDRYRRGVPRLETYIGQLDAAIDEQNEAAAAAIAQAKARRKQLAEMMDNAEKKAPADSLKALERQLEAIDGLIAGDNAEAAKAVVELINDAYRVLADAVKEDGDAKTFDALAARYKTNFAKLPTDMLGKEWTSDLKARQAEYQQQLKDLTEAPGRLNMGAELAKLRDIGKRWARMIEQFTKLAVWQNATGERIAALEADLKTLDKTLKGSRGTAYDGTIRPDLASIKAEYQTPRANRGGIDQQLAQMEKSMKSYLDGSGIDIISGTDMMTALGRDEAGQKQRVKEEADAEAQRKQDLADWLKFKESGFEFQYDACKKVVKAAKGGDTAALKKVKELFETAKGHAKEYDFETANKELEVCLAQLADLKTYPQGIGEKSRDQLVKLAHRWIDASRTFAGRIRQVGGKAAERGRAVKLPETQVTQVEQRLGDLADRLFAQCEAAGTTFTTVFNILKDGDPSKEDCLKMREEALRAVRTVRKALRDEPLLDSVRVNPFTAVDTDVRLEEILTDIALNATLAV